MNEHLAVAAELRMAHRQQEEPELEPAARIDRDVIGPAGRRIHDTPFNLSERLSRGALDIHFVTLNRLIGKLTGIDVP